MNKIYLTDTQLKTALIEAHRQRSACAHRLIRRLWQRLRHPFGPARPAPSVCAGCAG